MPSSMPLGRLPRRLLVHHLPIGMLTIASATLLYATKVFPEPLERLSFASAYPALILISLTLLIGPLKLLNRNRVPVSIDLRRDLGIWAGMTGVFHAGVGQFVHQRGRPWLYYVFEEWPRPFPIRYDVFGIANYTGLFATFVLLMLLATSNDASLRKLRVPGWKGLQRWNYACFGLAAIHTLLYQVVLESQAAPFVATAIFAIVVTMLVQWRGYKLRQSRAAAA